MMTDRATNTSFYIYHYLFLATGSVSEQRCGSWESFFPHWCVWLVAYYSPCSAVDVIVLLLIVLKLEAFLGTLLWHLSVVQNITLLLITSPYLIPFVRAIITYLMITTPSIILSLSSWRGCERCYVQNKRSEPIWCYRHRPLRFSEWVPGLCGTGYSWRRVAVCHMHR